MPKRYFGTTYCWRSKRRRSVLVKLGIPALTKEPEKGNCWFEFRISTNESGKYFAKFSKKHDDFDSSIYKEKNRVMIFKLPIKYFLLPSNKKKTQADVRILIYHLHLFWTQIAWNRVHLWNFNSCVPFRPLYEKGLKMPITIVRVTLYQKKTKWLTTLDWKRNFSDSKVPINLSPTHLVSNIRHQHRCNHLKQLMFF